MQQVLSPLQRMSMSSWSCRVPLSSSHITASECSIRWVSLFAWSEMQRLAGETWVWDVAIQSDRCYPKKNCVWVGGGGGRRGVYYIFWNLWSCVSYAPNSLIVLFIFLSLQAGCRNPKQQIVFLQIWNNAWLLVYNKATRCLVGYTDMSRYYALCSGVNKIFYRTLCERINHFPPLTPEWTWTNKRFKATERLIHFGRSILPPCVFSHKWKVQAVCHYSIWQYISFYQCYDSTLKHFGYKICLEH